MPKKIYEVKTRINGEITCLLVFNTRTAAQKYIKEKLEKIQKENVYVRYAHYTRWGRYKTPYHEMTLDSFTAEFKDYVMNVYLNTFHI